MWYRYILLTSLATLSTFHLFAQKDYDDYSAAQRTDVLYEDFDDNRNKWFVGYERKGRRSGEIRDGQYVWQSKSLMYDEHASWNQVSLDQTRDFEIETRLKLVDGNPKKSIALSWGRSDRGSFFFGFKENKYYVSDWRKVGGVTIYVDGRQTSHLNRNDYNTLTVRKVDRFYRFFINEKLVYSMNFKDFYGSNIGFESNNLIHVDYLRVSYLDEPSTLPLASKNSQNELSDNKPPKEEANLDQAQEVEVPPQSKPKENLVPDSPPTQIAASETSTDKPSTSEPTVANPNEINTVDTPEPISAAASAGDNPIIVITEPTLTRGFKQIAVQNIRIVGRATDQDGIKEVLINGQPAWLRPDGQFSLEAPLRLGDNKFDIVATDRFQQSSTSTFSIHRDAPSREKRLALIIGNSAYEQGGQLRNPINDANAMQSTLESMGFTVMKYENCRQNDIKRAIDEFGQKLKEYEVGLFFYAGHGVQVSGSNYLIPVDAQLSSAHDVEYDCVRADRVLAKMEAANSRTNIVMLDACRDNPFERSWSRSTQGNGLAFMNAPQGSMVAYATAPGQTASDGGGQHGIYTEALLKHLPTPNITIEQVFKRVRSTVAQKSEGKQIPWESTSLTGDFYFKK
ncbi:caspase family protein [Tunicatimonas pelagia]|uniref:caspase family protein n=1 Tax=Tunicatimonas pelagia TaxID=931531 RepID=UPI0026653496|nr:caspase family protein [Tunicatimonas pelagia]WKN44413.1 caspase family protein [Tunicatimonas pelagia]